MHDDVEPRARTATQKRGYGIGALAAREMERRFKQELVLARQVTHKNVVRIHDLGEIDGIKYITMSYVDGTDLATRLKHEGKQPVAAVMRLARSVASGLVAAHSAGVSDRRSASFRSSDRSVRGSGASSPFR
jgi:serine/threonine protein kinase